MRPQRRPWFLVCLVFSSVVPAFAQEPSKSESAYLKLLKKAPAERVGQIVDIIGKRGTSDDLAAVFDRAVEADGFAPPIRLKAFEVLAEAALTRDLQPKVDPVKLCQLIETGPPAVRLAAIKLAGAWKAEATVLGLVEVARAKDNDTSAKIAAFAALAKVDNPQAREAIESLASRGSGLGIRALAIAAMTRFDVDRAATLASGILTDDARIEDITPMIGAFLDRQGGGEKLAVALKAHRPSADGARLALRAVYALGRSDEALIAVLAGTAGIEAEPRLPTREEMDTLVQEVATKGDSRRGEAIFRRGELNCMKCHAIAGAAGGVGPELSSLGLSSPVDYVVNSILIPDQAIKEEYQTRVVLTDDGRVLQGIVVEEDDKRLVLKDATGEKRTIPVASIEDSKKGGSLMPKGLAGLLTRAEFVDLVRFLSELGKPGPYALRTAPTLQRWRVLKTSPDSIAKILQADPADWSPAYGQMNGDLPLADVVGLTAEKSAILQGEIAVSAAGPITFQFGSKLGLTAWLDDHPLPSTRSATVEVAEGVHKLTLRIDLSAQETSTIRVEVTKAEGSRAQFSVVGGR